MPPVVSGSGDPCLLLLPREGGRDRSALLSPTQFDALREDLDWLAKGLNHHGVEEITVAGAGQHALFAWVGAHWDRTSGARLRLAGRASNHPVLEGPPGGPPRAPADAAPSGPCVLVLCGSSTAAAQRDAARAYAATEGLVDVVIEHPPLLETQAELDALCAQVEAAARAGGARRVVLLCIGPTFVAAAAATRLTLHFARPLEIAEFDAASQGYRTLTLRP